MLVLLCVLLCPGFWLYRVVRMSEIVELPKLAYLTSGQLGIQIFEREGGGGQFWLRAFSCYIYS